MVPPFEPATGNLPPGIHEATWTEVVAAFSYTERRQAMLDGLRIALGMLRTAGCRRVYLNGSFVTSKRDPGDFDACWEMEGVDLPRLARSAPVLFDFRPGRRAQKAEYGGELFPIDPDDQPETNVLRAFQRDQRTGEPKGIVVIDLGTLP